MKIEITGSMFVSGKEMRDQTIVTEHGMSPGQTVIVLIPGQVGFWLETLCLVKSESRLPGGYHRALGLRADWAFDLCEQKYMLFAKGKYRVL